MIKHHICDNHVLGKLPLSARVQSDTILVQNIELKNVACEPFQHREEDNHSACRTRATHVVLVIILQIKIQPERNSRWLTSQKCWGSTPDVASTENCSYVDTRNRRWPVTAVSCANTDVQQVSPRKASERPNSSDSFQNQDTGTENAIGAVLDLDCKSGCGETKRQIHPPTAPGHHRCGTDEVRSFKNQPDIFLPRHLESTENLKSVSESMSPRLGFDRWH